MGFINGNLRHLLEDSMQAGTGKPFDVHIHMQDGVTIMNYVNAVPPLAEKWLDQLYGNIFSSLAHFRIYDGVSGVHTYIASRNEQVLAVLLYRNEGARVKVLNEVTRLPAEEINRFAHHVFDSFPPARRVSLHAVVLEGAVRDFPLQRFNCLEDIVLCLPSSVDAYTTNLGKSTRNYISRYRNKLKRDYPSMQNITYSRDEIQEEHIREILELNRCRMEGKGRLTPWTESDKKKMLEMARECGVVHVIAIDGRICAGTINYCVNGNYFLEVIAHAPEYNDYRLGTLCCFATICKCIEQGGKEYHFLWGPSEYKFRLGGIQQDLEHISVFRSRLHMIADPRLVLGGLYRSYRRRTHLWVKEMRRRESRSGKLLGGVILALDSIRLGWQRQRHQWLKGSVKRAVDSAGSGTAM